MLFIIAISTVAHMHCPSWSCRSSSLTHCITASSLTDSHMCLGQGDGWTTMQIQLAWKVFNPCIQGWYKPIICFSFAFPLLFPCFIFWQPAHHLHHVLCNYCCIHSSPHSLCHTHPCLLLSRHSGVKCTCQCSQAIQLGHDNNTHHPQLNNRSACWEQQPPRTEHPQCCQLCSK